MAIGPALAVFLTYFDGTSSAMTAYMSGFVIILLSMLTTTFSNAGKFKTAELGMRCRVAFTVIVFKKVRHPFYFSLYIV